MKQQRSQSLKPQRGLPSPHRSENAGLVGRKSAYAEYESKTRNNRATPQNRLMEHEDEDADSKNSSGDSKNSSGDYRKSGSDSRKSVLSGFGKMSRKVSTELRRESLKLRLGINVIDTDATDRNLLS